MLQLIEEVDQILEKAFQERAQRVILNALLDMGECMGEVDKGTALADFTDAVPCDADASVALIGSEYEGIVLCARCYSRHQQEVSC